MMRAPVGRSVPRRRPSSGDEGAVAVLVAITVTLLIVLVAVAVDTARWYVEVARVQKVADAAALGGVVSMPETADAIVEARRIAAANGFVDQVGGVTVLPFGAPSSKTRLYVTVTSPVSNGFGGLFGRPTTPITRTALADYQPNALLGSPCNAFGNEPDSTTAPGTTPAPALPVDSVQPDSPPGWETCDTTPGLWAMIQGPLSNKRNGDRYANRRCTRETPRTYECTDGEFNTEYRDDNYYWTVRVPTEAIGVPVSVQIYDPAYVANGQTCSGFDGAPGDTGSIDFNRYVFPYAPSDASLRYLDDQNEFCTGDLNTTYPTGANGPVNTTFELLYPHPSGDPKLSTPVATCTKQFAGYTGANANEVATRIPTYDRFGNFDRQVASTNYNAGLASVYHQWVNLCTFTPLASQIGDYYLHVSSNIALGAGAPGLTPSPAGVYSYRDGVDVLPDALCPTSGQPRTGSECDKAGTNAFAVRAYGASAAAPTTPDEDISARIAVSGWERMPMWINDRGPALFNLIQILPNARGKSFTFSGFDFGDCGLCVDGRGNPIPATVTVLTPQNSTGTLASDACQGVGPIAGTLANCTFPISSSTHQGQLQEVTVQVPRDYECATGPGNPATVQLGDCWWQMEITYPADPNDVTTWDAVINGDVVRLLE